MRLCTNKREGNANMVSPKMHGCIYGAKGSMYAAIHVRRDHCTGHRAVQRVRMTPTSFSVG